MMDRFCSFPVLFRQQAAGAARLVRAESRAARAGAAAAPVVAAILSGRGESWIVETLRASDGWSGPGVTRVRRDQ